MADAVATPVKNYKIVHNGMPWPAGSVIPAHAAPKRIDQHLELGSIVETEDPVNIEVQDAKIKVPMSSEALTEKERLEIKQEFDKLTGKLAETRTELKTATATIKTLEDQVAALTKDRDDWKALAEHKDKEFRDRYGATGPINP